MRRLSAISYRLSAGKEGAIGMSGPTADGRQPTARAGFTLIELMVAIIVLLIVIAATSRIFGTVTQVTGLGAASASVLQEAAVIERRMREDIANLSTEGLFAIRQVAVRNNVNQQNDPNAPLLNPMLPPDAIIRADQLVFFANNLQQPQTARINEQGRTRGQGIAARVYYGHAFQLPNAPGYEPNGLYEGTSWDLRDLPQGNNLVQARGLVPWYWGAAPDVPLRQSNHQTGGGPSLTNYQQTGGNVNIDGNQPEARQWLLVRQPVLLVDDDHLAKNTDAKTVYAGEIASDRSIFLFNENMGNVYGNLYDNQFLARQILNGRVDAAATQMGDVRRRIRYSSNAADNNTAPWGPRQTPVGQSQRDRISRQLIYYPRAERIPPSMHRVDEALSHHVIGSAVSSFIVEWTYDNGTGDLYDADGYRLVHDGGGFAGTIVSERDIDPAFLWFDWFPFGFYSNRGGSDFTPAHPWFGLNTEWCPDCPNRGVGFYSDNDGQGSYQDVANFKQADTILAFANGGQIFSAVEEYDVAHNRLPGFGPQGFSGVLVYEALFGYNRTQPIDPATGERWGEFEAGGWNAGVLTATPNAYTPWPSAIRVTMVLHDPANKLENGREVQFVIELPRRAREAAR